ncbi:hypothetical protein ACPPVU_05840 [Mucilaginibacter sp. McL0603]|uniref:hypothetical protein n=1 Tax=Mucilaginibacter sp. McL0603 TaxID=3415670 RepID=UPI003CEEF712
MRNLKKLLLLLCAFCFLSFRQDKIKRIVIVAYREPELMYGNIKQVIELRPDRKVEGDKPQLVPDDTTLFSKAGDPIRTNFGEKGYAASYVTYYTKYDSSQIRVETAVYVDLKSVYYFDSNGRVTKREEPGPTQPISLVLYHYK